MATGASEAVRRRSRAFNGGRVEPRTFGEDSVGQIQCFLSIGPSSDAAYTWDMFKHRECPRMPPEHIPIARCEGGDLLTMVLDEISA